MKQTPDNTQRAWNKLIETAIKTNKQKSFNVSLEFEVDGETWQSYGAEVSNREISFYCKQGHAIFLVDSYGDKNTVELFDWEKSGL